MFLLHPSVMMFTLSFFLVLDFIAAAKVRDAAGAEENKPDILIS